MENGSRLESIRKYSNAALKVENAGRTYDHGL